jgi:glycosyltransferase involved in cell wall biosynthesis
MPEENSRSRKGTIAYISHFFPALTQTFVYREIQALEDLGWEVKPFSIRRPTKGISEEAAALAARTTYLLPIRPLLFLRRQARLFLAHPLRYLRILAHFISRPGETLRSRVHALTHFFGGMHLVPEVERAGARHFHAHFGRNPATLALAASEYLGIPFSMTIHARDLFVEPSLLRAKLEKARFVASISEYNRAILLRLAPGAKERIHVLHCGIDLERFSPAPRARDAGRPPVFFAVGRLVPKKGYLYLVEAARILKDRGVPFEARVIGGGPDQDLLARRIAELGVGDRVKLEGPMPQERLLPLLRDADAFVLPCVLAPDGDQDGIPVSLMEAMAYAIPCVSTRISGIPELIEDGKDGLLVAEKDPEALANALEALARDPSLRERLGAAGRRKVEASFNLAGLARDLDRLYAESVGIAAAPLRTESARTA